MCNQKRKYTLLFFDFHDFDRAYDVEAESREAAYNKVKHLTGGLKWIALEHPQPIEDEEGIWLRHMWPLYLKEKGVDD